MNLIYEPIVRHSCLYQNSDGQLSTSHTIKAILLLQPYEEYIASKAQQGLDYSGLTEIATAEPYKDIPMLSLSLDISTDRRHPITIESYGPPPRRDRRIPRGFVEPGGSGGRKRTKTNDPKYLRQSDLCDGYTSFVDICGCGNHRDCCSSIPVGDREIYCEGKMHIVEATCPSRVLLL